MADANWYWAEGANRNGPVAGGAIARLVADGKLGPDDLIWKEGMPDWVAVRKVPALMKYVQVPAGAALQALPPAAEAGGDPNEPQLAAAVQPIRRIQPVGYYNPAGSLPPRAAGTLARHARPRGDVGDWPLDDAQVARFDEALKLRKRIDSAASLFRLMMLLMTIADVVVVIAAVVAMASARAAPGPFGLGMAVGAAFCIALTALYFFAWNSFRPWGFCKSLSDRHQFSQQPIRGCRVFWSWCQPPVCRCFRFHLFQWVLRHSQVSSSTSLVPGIAVKDGPEVT